MALPARILILIDDRTTRRAVPGFDIDGVESPRPWLETISRFGGRLLQQIHEIGIVGKKFAQFVATPRRFG